FFFQAEDGIRDFHVTGVQTCALPILGTTQSCVTPVYLKGSIPEAMALVKDLRENHGIFCSIVVYPVIPKGLILLRMIPTATHTMQDIEETLEAFSAIRERLENGTYKRLSAAVAEAMGE